MVPAEHSLYLGKDKIGIEIKPHPQPDAGGTGQFRRSPLIMPLITLTSIRDLNGGLSSKSLLPIMSTALSMTTFCSGPTNEK